MASWLSGDFSSDRSGRTYKPLTKMISLNSLDGGGDGGRTTVNGGYEDAGRRGGGGGGGGGGDADDVSLVSAQPPRSSSSSSSSSAPLRQVAKSNPNVKVKAKLNKGGISSSKTAEPTLLPLAAQLYEEEKAQYLADANGDSSA